MMKIIPIRNYNSLKFHKQITRQLKSSSRPYKGYIWISSINDVISNLAFEKSLFEREIYNEQHLFIWRNSPCIIIGRHQNAWSECNIDAIKSDGITLTRRHSGGGAVYQDLGNTCFSFLGPKNYAGTEANNSILLSALKKKFGINGVATGRNDLVVDGLKFSGSGYKHSNSASLHHGTLLLNLDSSKLPLYLTPNKLKLESKGITSVESRVINLGEINPSINHDNISEAIINEFLDHYQFEQSDVQTTEITNDSEIYLESGIRDYIDTLRSWEWVYGKTPTFTHKLESRFDFGTFEICLNVQKGVIISTEIFTDYLYSQLVEKLKNALIDITYTPDALEKALSTSELESPLKENMIQFKDWIIHQVKY